MVEGLLIVDLDASVLVFNPPAETLLGLLQGSLYIGQRLSEYGELAELCALIDRCGAGTALGFEYCTLSVGGRHSVRAEVTVLPAAEGARPTLLVLLHDASEIERLQSMRRDFVANVSHEVRTPLAAIRGCSATLLAGALDDRQRARRFVEVIDQNADRLGHLVDDLSCLADLEQGRIELQCRPVAVAPLVAAAAAVCRDLAVHAAVTLNVSVASETPAVYGDPDLLEQALVRLIENAIRYTPRAGSVTVTAAPAENGIDAADGAGVRFAVVDTGAGIPPQDLPRLSERFYRVDKARSRVAGGSGLGLAIVKHIVQAHGGAFHIASEWRNGTCVTLLWPSHASPPQHSADATPALPRRSR